MERWYYTHGGQRLGPVSAEDLERLTGEGSLLPTDLLWRMGADKSTAVEAGTVLIALAQTTGYVPNRTPADSSTVAAPRVGEAVPTSRDSGPTPTPAVLPDWLSDVQAAETGPPSPNVALGGAPSALTWQPPQPGTSRTSEPCPDWLNDLHGSKNIELGVGPEAAATKESGAEKATGSPAVAQTSMTPEVGQSLPTACRGSSADAAPRTEAARSLPERSRPAASSLGTILRHAQYDLEAWVDAPANQALIAKGEIRVILAERTVQTLLARYRIHGATVQERLRSMLRSLIESRRKRLAEAGGE